MYKLFKKIITQTTRLEKKLDENQPREQAGFRSKYSTTEHIHAINQLKEKCREYNIPLCVAFVDYEKAFDSVQTQAILTSLQEEGIEDHINPERYIYTDSSVIVHLHKESEKISIEREVRQGDTISPKLFTATLKREQCVDGNCPSLCVLGTTLHPQGKEQEKEIQRRILAGWAAYAKHREIFKSNLAICLKRQVYNSCVLPAMTYGAETWTLTKQHRTNLWPHRPKWKEVCSTSHTKIEGPTSGPGRGQKS